MKCFCGANPKEVGIELYSGCEAGHTTLEFLEGLHKQLCERDGCTLVDNCPLDNGGDCVLEE